MAEWFKALVLKTSVGESLPWVRIPPSPPLLEDYMFKHVKIDYDLENLQVNKDNHTKLNSMKSKIMNKDTKFPDSFCEQNTTIYQKWWDRSEIDFENLGAQLGMKIETISTIILPPGNNIPWHTDTFVKMQELYPDRNDFVRAMIYVQDYAPGQMTQIQNGAKYETYTFWKQGEGYLIDDSIPHVNVNGGFEDTITINLSGIII